MSKFLQKISRTLKLFNRFSRPKHGPAHNEPSTSVLDHEQDNLTTADDESDTRRQEVGSNTLDKSSTIPIDLVTRARAAPSVGDRITLCGEERRDDAKSESQKIGMGKIEEEMEDSGEKVYNQQGRESTPSQETGTPAGVVERQQQQLEEKRGSSEEPQLAMDSIFQENIQKEIPTTETAAKPKERPAWFGTNTNPSGPEQISKLAVAPSTARLSQASSISLSAPLRHPGEETLTLDAPVESGRASSNISPWEAYDRPFPIFGSVSMSADDHPILPQNESPSRRQQSLLLGLELGPPRARPVLSVISTQAESPAPSVRLRAQSSNDSLSTTSSMSVSSTWEGTILDMEYKSAKGGEPVYFQAKLDTFARRDAIAENIVKRLDMNWKPDPKGRTFKVMGDGADAGTVIHPLGYVMLSLRVVGRPGRLISKFYVLADSDVGRAFDCLLGCSTTMHNFLALKEEGTHQENLTEDPRDE